MSSVPSMAHAAVTGLWLITDVWDPLLKTLIHKFVLESGKWSRWLVRSCKEAKPWSGEDCQGLESGSPDFSLSLCRATQCTGPSRFPCLWWGLNLFLPLRDCVRIKPRDSKKFQKLYGPIRNHFKSKQSKVRERNEGLVGVSSISGWSSWTWCSR